MKMEWAVHADGSELETEEDGSIIENYVMDDGSLEYHMVLAKSDEKGFFMGKNLHVEFKNLGTVAKATIHRILMEHGHGYDAGGADVSRSQKRNRSWEILGQL